MRTCWTPQESVSVNELRIIGLNVESAEVFVKLPMDFRLDHRLQRAEEESEFGVHAQLRLADMDAPIHAASRKDEGVAIPFADDGELLANRAGRFFHGGSCRLVRFAVLAADIDFRHED